jgi:hypothetical protein
MLERQRWILYLLVIALMTAAVSWAARRMRLNRLELQSASPVVALFQLKITELKRNGDNVDLDYVLERYSNHAIASGGSLKRAAGSPDVDVRFTWEEESGKEHTWQCPGSIHIRFFDEEGNDMMCGFDCPFRPNWHPDQPPNPFWLCLLGSSKYPNPRYPGSIEFIGPPGAHLVSLSLTPDLTTRPVPLPPINATMSTRK